MENTQHREMLYKILFSSLMWSLWGRMWGKGGSWNLLGEHKEKLCADPFTCITSFNPHNTLQGGYYAWLLFTEKQPEAQRGYIIC